ncbi:MAG: Sir2 silent information regulator family NAD-dependent deacetylase [Selenomonadaceae bacterium]|nr:Sir2 silent information regulator family NAD-dependent deacetylase [Selenomonadaceae bacterium]
MTDKISTASKILRDAKNILIGAGAGLSTAAGYTYSGARFEKYFSDFEREYGFHDMYSGGFYPYETPEEFWAFWSRNIFYNRYDQPPSEVHAKLLQLVRDKNYFVLTTNVDHLFQNNGFDKARLFYTQGDYGLFQCPTPCHQKTYDNEKVIREMLAAQKDMRVPAELFPHCPKCGEMMTTNLRSDDNFVEDEGWHAAAKRYENFLRENLMGDIVYLELGVGGNTPGIIKYPFWDFTAENPRAKYICVNFGEAFVPQNIASQSIAINADIKDFLAQI